MSHCRRELFHEVWKLLLEDEEFLKAYVNGIVITCSDGVTRRIFPRIFSYSADYPEKSVPCLILWKRGTHTLHRVLIATVRDMGLCPCPRCLIAKAAIPKLGTVRDFQHRIRWARHDDIRYRTKIGIARNIIYNKGFSLTGSALQNVLKTESLVPTRVGLSHILYSLSY